MGGESIRSVFFDNCDAVIFVWDVSDESTYHSLHRWLMEINARSDGIDMSDDDNKVVESDIESGIHKFNKESPPRSVSRAKSGVEHRPLLLVGNKKSYFKTLHRIRFGLFLSFGAPESVQAARETRTGSE